jgi:hypothetical protein
VSRALVAALLLIGAGCTASGRTANPAPPSFVPPPFLSDRPIDESQRELDAIISSLSGLLMSNNPGEAERVIEGSAMRLVRIAPVRYGYGEFSGRSYAWADEPCPQASEEQCYGTHLHFSLEDSNIKFFVPSMCGDLIRSNYESLRLGQFVLVSPHDSPHDPNPPDVSVMYFDMRCHDDLHLRMFFDTDDDPSVVSQVMMYRARSGS